MRWPLKNGLSLIFDSFDIHYLLRQPIPLENVTLRYTSEGDREVDGSHLEEARQRWDAENNHRSLRGKPALEASTLFRPVSATWANDTFTIYAGITTYFDNFYLQTPSDGWNEGTLVGAGLSVVPVCRDEHILIGMRSGVVASGTGKYHVAGGHAHPPPDFTSVPARLAGAALEELDEEMHIHDGDVKQLRFLGLAIDLTRSKPEFIVEAELKEESTEYISRWHAQVAQEKPADKRQEEFSELQRLDSLLMPSDDTAQRPEEALFTLSSLWREREHLVPACQAALTALWLCHNGANKGDVMSVVDITW